MTGKIQQSEDYISASGIKETFLNIIKALFLAVAFVFDAIRRRWWLFLLIIAAGLTAGYLYYTLRPRIYKYSMVTRFSGMDRRSFYAIVEQLNATIAGAATDDLSKGLHIKQEDAGQVVAFEASGPDERAMPGDSAFTSGLLTISVSTLRPVDPLALQNGILEFFDSRPYLKELKQNQREAYRQKMIYIDAELAKLDSLKDAYRKSIVSRPAATIYNNEFNPADVYKQSMTLMSEKANLIRWSSLEEKSLYLVDGFKNVAAPVYLPVKRYVILAGLAALMVAVMVCVVIETRKLLF